MAPSQHGRKRRLLFEGKAPKDLGAELAGYVKEGFAAVKMKVGRLGVAEEEERVRAAHEAIGPHI